MSKKLAIAMFGQKRLSREGGVEIVVRELCTRMVQKPDILIVGLGCPKQEKFMYHHCKELGVPISFGLGASLDFEAGNIKRAPRWMADHGLEWLFRITQDPKRMAKRYLINDRKILKLAIKYKKQV